MVEEYDPAKHPNEPFIVLSDQDSDWSPVIRNFITECALEGLVEIKHVRPVRGTELFYDENRKQWKRGAKLGPQETRIVLGDVAKSKGYLDIKALWNHWVNKVGIFATETQEN